MIKNALAFLFVATVWLTVPAQTRITIDHNTGATATNEFKFQRLPSPARDDKGSKARLILIDGRLPTDEDEPAANLFFNAGSFGGRIRMGFDSAIEIAQVNTYSWHSNSRAPQLYKLYGSDGADPKFDPAPQRGIDPAGCGWKFIATVSTIPDSGEEGGQYGVSITDPRGSLGRYRYLLFDIYPSEIIDNWGNTFYSEIDVLTRK